MKNENSIMKHWALQAFGDERFRKADAMVSNYLSIQALKQCISYDQFIVDFSLIEKAGMAWEFVAIENYDYVLKRIFDDNAEERRIIAKESASRAFDYYRVLPIPDDDLSNIFFILHLSGIAYCGDRWPDLRRLIVDENIEFEPQEEVEWDRYLLCEIFNCWLLLLKKKNWKDISGIVCSINKLREKQGVFEKQFLNKFNEINNVASAFRLMVLYHLAKATELISRYMINGDGGEAKTLAEIDKQFEDAKKAVVCTTDKALELIICWLHISATMMIKGALWSLVSIMQNRNFIKNEIENRGIIELLPPQRMAVKEMGLLDPAKRAVIVELPTSGGKTALAQFRILQALNLFHSSNGWVAYVAPTRALVGQITRRLKQDFNTMNIVVEQLSGAIDIDFVENEVLDKNAFNILVATPEKLQHVIRNKRINRPLSLIVMDEAHNIEDGERGLRIELLLATIKQDRPEANFLLLMPYVPNARDLAQWLAPDQNGGVSLGIANWRANDQIIGIFKTERGNKKGDWSLNFESLTTSRNTLLLKGVHKVGNGKILNKTYTQLKSLSMKTAAMAKVFSNRGVCIAVAQKIHDAWKMARVLSAEMEELKTVPEEIRLVQRYIATEIDPHFELIEMLNKGIAVHHAGLPTELLSLIENLVELNKIKILCATTTIAQGLNFPVSSVFMSSYKYPYGKQMSPRAFWNLAGRVGRIDHKNIGVIGIASNDQDNEIRKFVSEATGNLLSRLETMVDDLIKTGGEVNLLDKFISEEQWADYRGFVAHLWNEKRELDAVINDTEQLLRNTYGFNSLNSSTKIENNKKAEILLQITKQYIKSISKNSATATLADSTGFSPEGVQMAISGLSTLGKKLNYNDWRAESLFGREGTSQLQDLFGIMLKIPELKKSLREITSKDKYTSTMLSNVTRQWVMGDGIAKIAQNYFDGDDFTDKLTKACKAIYRNLSNSGAWGISALTKTPASGIDFDGINSEDKRRLNMLPSMIYYGVNSEAAVLMRMNFVPRSIADNLGKKYSSQYKTLDYSKVENYIYELNKDDWDSMRPKDVHMSGEDYYNIWRLLSGKAGS